MLPRTRTSVARAVLVASLLAVVSSAVLRPAGAGEPLCGGRDGDAIAELKKRVAQLEAEVAEMRKALRRAGGVPDHATEIKNVSQVAKLRAADLLQRAQNLHAVLREITSGNLAGQALHARINDLNNDLTSLWMTMAGSGLGRDPYLDNIQLSASGFGSAKPPPDLGIPGPYVALGLPRLYQRYLEASAVKGKAAEEKQAKFDKLVEAYANPGVYRHRAFGDRAYNDYRNGKGLFTPQYEADLKALQQWLTALEAVLQRVPAYFDKAP
jgi:hypothetical protein